MKKVVSKVVTICYGDIREWDDRQKAMDFYEEGFGCSDGCEALRYAKVFFDLYDGFPVAWDCEEVPDMNPALKDLFIRCHPWMKEEDDD